MGKTSFFLNFAEYLGVSKCEVKITGAKGERLTKTYSISLAKKYLISESPYKTKDIYQLDLTVPIYKGSKEFTLLDTSGLVDGISESDQIRRSMVQTLDELYLSDILLHMIDASSMIKGSRNNFTKIDHQINEYGRIKGKYCILANKMDLAESKTGLEQIKNEFKNSYIIPVSALKKTGFKEVRMFVGRNI